MVQALTALLNTSSLYIILGQIDKRIKRRLTKEAKERLARSIMATPQTPTQRSPQTPSEKLASVHKQRDEVHDDVSNKLLMPCPSSVSSCQSTFHSPFVC